MHIILGLLGTIVTILVLLNRLSENGIDIGWLNPFSWHRRRKYRLNHDLNPVFKSESPMEVAAIYLLTMVKIDGDMTSAEKAAILNMFTSEFHLSEQEAKDLLSSTSHLLGNGQEVFASPGRVVERAYSHFSEEQVISTLELLNRIAEVDGSMTSQQEKLLQQITKSLPQAKQTTNKW